MDEKDIHLKMNPHDFYVKKIYLWKKLLSSCHIYVLFLLVTGTCCKEVIPYHMLRHRLYTAKLDPVSDFSLQTTHIDSLHRHLLGMY